MKSTSGRFSALIIFDGTIAAIQQQSNNKPVAPLVYNGLILPQKALLLVINTHCTGTGKAKSTTCYIPTSHKAVMYIRNYDKAEYEIAGSKLAADTMVYRITSLGLSVLGILWTLGKTRKSIVYNLIHRDYTTVAHTMTALIKDGYVHEQVISRREKYISLSDRGKELYTQFINKSITLTRELKSIKTAC